MPRRRKRGSHLQEIKAMSDRDDILPDVKMPKIKQFRNKSPKKKPAMREKELEAQALIWLNTQPGITARKVESDPMYNKRWSCHGHSDLIVFCTKWQAIFYIELKVGRNKQRETQIWFEDLCNQCGVPYLVIRSLKELEIVFGS